MKRVILSIGGFLVVLMIAIGVYYLIDSRQRIEVLRSGGTLVQTSAGPVEYQLTGSSDGGVVLFFHGMSGGYDQGIAGDSDTQVLTLSRPGYLGTPLTTGATPAEQARWQPLVRCAEHLRSGF